MATLGLNVDGKLLETLGGADQGGAGEDVAVSNRVNDVKVDLGVGLQGFLCRTEESARTVRTRSRYLTHAHAYRADSPVRGALSLGVGAASGTYNGDTMVLEVRARTKPTPQSVKELQE